jgi:hypothetical protein
VIFFKFTAPAVLALALGTVPMPAIAAQSSVTVSDIQRLQDDIADASRDVAQVRNRDGAFAKNLQSELDDAREEATYLKVKVRRNETVGQSEYADLRDRIANIRNRARGDSNGPYTPPSAGTSIDPADRDRDRDRDSRPTSTIGRSQNDYEIPVGTEFDVRLQGSLSSRTAQVEDRVDATTMVDLMQGSRVLVPAGSVMRGVISSVTKATRLERKGALTVAFDRGTVNGRSYPLRATVTQALESEGIMGEKEKIGAGAGVGAIIGGILGGFKGVLAGILIGGGGTIAATEGKDVELPAGTVLRLRLDAPLIVSPTTRQR